MSKSIVLEKSINFALRIVKLYQYLSDEKKEFVLSKQILISGTYIAKHAKAATQADGRTNFSRDMNIALQRASETEFWLMLLKSGGYLESNEYESINTDCVELIKMLTKIVLTTKENV
jgi:TIGR02436 family protein